MTVYEIKLVGLPSNYEQIVTLDGIDYLLWLLWNDRSQHYFMTIRDADGIDLITARKIVVNIPFAVHDRIESAPVGQLWFIDTTGSGIDPALRELGQRVQLLYIDEASLP